MRAIATKQPTNDSAQQKRRGNSVRSACSSTSRSRSVSPLSTGIPLLQRKCACGGGCPRCQEDLGIQTKLKIGKPEDKYEQEADRIADEVMRMPEPSVQRQIEPEEEEEEEETLQTKSKTSQVPTVTPSIHNGISRLRQSSGEVLPTSTRAFLEPRFGHDFSHVKIHTSPQAADLSRSVNARAFTVGHNIFFNQGEFQPNTQSGKRLLAHELTHVLQQQGSIHPKHLLQRSSNAGAESTKEPLGKGKTCEEISKDPRTKRSVFTDPRWFTNSQLDAVRKDPVFTPDCKRRSNNALIAPGAKGEAVELLQDLLWRWGCFAKKGNLLQKFGVDGKYGKETANAVATFQAEFTGTEFLFPCLIGSSSFAVAPVDVDGIVGPVTLPLLDNFVNVIRGIRPPKPKPIKPKIPGKDDRICGPEIKESLIQNMRDAISSNDALRIRLILLTTSPPVSAPSVRISAFIQWALLVRTGGLWDIKNNLYGSSLAISGCRRFCKGKIFSVTLDGVCMTSEVTGNIFYGFVGRSIGFSESELLNGAAVAQFVDNFQLGDDPRDVQAIRKGFALFNTGSPSGLDGNDLQLNHYDSLGPGEGDPIGCTKCSAKASVQLPT